MSIASGLMDKLLEFALANPDKAIVEVRLSIGELMHIEHEQLRFCYEAISAGTILEGSTLEIETIHSIVQCPHCSYFGEPKYWDDILVATSVVTLQCPQCGKSAEAIRGHECAIRSVRYRETAIT